MDAGPNTGYIKPERLCSGFFIMLLLAIAAWNQPGSALLDELLWSRTASPVPASDTGASSLRAVMRGTYHDLYYRRTNDTGAIGGMREEIAARSPLLDGTMRFQTSSWGCMVQGRAGGIFAKQRDNIDGYDIRVGVPMNTVSGSAWYQRYGLSISGTIGYDRGLDAAYSFDGKKSWGNRLRSIPADPRFIHAVTCSYTLPRLSMTLYESKFPFLSALTVIKKESNRSTIVLPFASADQEIGIRETFRFGRDTLDVGVGVIRTTSDRGTSPIAALPMSITGNGNRISISAAAPDARWSPRLSCAWQYRSLRMRGYDGGAAAPYCYLDNNYFSHARLMTGFSLPWALDLSLYAEYAMFHSNLHGRFDPYPFSEFTIFNPVKYRLDSAMARYRTAGASIERLFQPFVRDRAALRLSTAWLELLGSLNTREYDFSFIIPRLIDPREWPLADERRLLITPEARYTIQWSGISCTGTLRQIIPLDVTQRGVKNGSVSSIKRSIHGGTTVSLSIEYGR